VSFQWDSTVNSTPWVRPCIPGYLHIDMSFTRLDRAPGRTLTLGAFPQPTVNPALQVGCIAPPPYFTGSDVLNCHLGTVRMRSEYGAHGNAVAGACGNAVAGALEIKGPLLARQLSLSLLNHNTSLHLSPSSRSNHDTSSVPVYLSFVLCCALPRPRRASVTPLTLSSDIQGHFRPSLSPGD
jgi:hypothetical protein